MASSEVDILKARVSSLEHELRLAKEQSVAVQLQAEREEEAITLKLMRRLEALQKQNSLLTGQVEQEEDFLANNLQKRLEKVAAEKAELEQRVVDLKRQTEQLAAEKQKLCKEKIDLEAALDSESEYIVNKLQVQLEKLGSEKKSLLREKSDLQKQVTDLGQAVDRLNRDKVKLEQEMEMEEESIVNRLQRQLEMLLHNLRLVETKLEAKGLTMRDLGIQPHELVASDAMRAYSRSPSSQSSVDKWSSPYNSGQFQLGSSPVAHLHTSSSSGSRREPRSSQGLAASASVPAPVASAEVVAKT